MKEVLFSAASAGWLEPLSQTPGGGWHHDMPWGWHGWWMGPIMWLIMLALAILAIVALWRVVSGGSGPRESVGSDRSLEILRERFARGEIDEEEFKARRRALGG